MTEPEQSALAALRECAEKLKALLPVDTSQDGPVEHAIGFAFQQVEGAMLEFQGDINYRATGSVYGATPPKPEIKTL